MGSVNHVPPRRYLNFPDAVKGPDVPYKNEKKSNPGLRGIVIYPAAFLLEWVGLIRQIVWNNTFGPLRAITTLIEDFEPWFIPEVVPLGEPGDAGVREIESKDSSPPTPNSVTGSEAKYDPAAHYYSLADYRRLYLSGELTPSDVAETLLPLIRRDTTPPGRYSEAWFDSKVELVLDAAAASTRRYQEKRSLGPLDGVPTGVKDEYDVEGYTTTLGSRNNYECPFVEFGSNKAWAVRKLEEAGAVILGKLHMPEFGIDTPGNSPVYGTPGNPWHKDYYTGGSSSGSAYAVSAGLIPFALGSDGGGSIRIPASMCGVFGLKPSHSRVANKPGQNHSASCATLGPIAADIESLTTVFQVIAAPHPSSPFPPMPRIRLDADASARKPKVLGIPEAWFARAPQSSQKLARSMIDRLAAKCGYEVVKVEIPFLVEGQIAHALTVLTDGATLLPDTSRLTPATKIMLALGRTSKATDFMVAQKLRRVLGQHLSWLWKAHPGMLLVTPTTSCAGWPVETRGELVHGMNDGDRTMQTMEFAWLANFCGNPAITVPSGFVTKQQGSSAWTVAGPDAQWKLPVGLMAMGEWCAEEQLLQFGLEAERLGVDSQERPPIWIDVVEEAKKRAWSRLFG